MSVFDYANNSLIALRDGKKKYETSLGDVFSLITGAVAALEAVYDLLYSAWSKYGETLKSDAVAAWDALKEAYDGLVSSVEDLFSGNADSTEVTDALKHMNNCAEAFKSVLPKE